MEETAALARRQAQQGAIEKLYSISGLDVPINVQRSGLRLQFDELRKQFEDLGTGTNNLADFLNDALGKLDKNVARAAQQARQGALERAYSLAGEEVPKAIQVAGLTAEFDDLRDLFFDLGLDSGILGGLLQKAIEKINKAGDDLKSGGFIGFIDEIGRITQLDPRMRDISANDPSFENIQGFATGTSNRIVTRPELFLAGERGPESVNVRPLSGSGNSGSQGQVNISLNGPAIFDDITMHKFTRTVAREMQSRQVRFG